MNHRGTRRDLCDRTLLTRGAFELLDMIMRREAAHIEEVERARRAAERGAAA
jgi:hypothetical protein